MDFQGKKQPIPKPGPDPKLGDGFNFFYFHPYLGKISQCD